MLKRFLCAIGWHDYVRTGKFIYVCRNCDVLRKTWP